MSQLNKKVLQKLNSNLLTLKDLRTRDRYWYKPFAEEEEYLDLICYTGWTPWNKDYKFLPLPSVWEAIRGGKERQGVVGQLDKFKEGYRQAIDHLPLRPKLKRVDPSYDNEREKELTARALAARQYEATHGRGSVKIPLKDKEGKATAEIEINKHSSFRLMEYFIVRNTNNILTIYTKNIRQLDFARSDIVFFFRGNKWTSKAKTQKDNRVLYWISAFDYINDRKGWVQLTLKKDYFWQYWGNAVNSAGKANIATSRLGTTHGKHKEDYQEQSEEYCRACDLCYTFCGDLRLKRAVPIGYVNPDKPKWQPKWKVGMATTKSMGGLGGYGVVNLGSDEAQPISVPNAVVVKCYRNAPPIVSSGDGNSPVLFFLLDDQHGEDGKPVSKKIHHPEKGKYYWEELPKAFALQPHLLNHSSLQVYFQKKLLFTANLRHVLVRRQPGGGGESGIAKDNLKFVLGYRVSVDSSIAGILYNFESQDIFFKWEVKVKGSYQSVDFLDAMIDGLFKAVGLGGTESLRNQIETADSGGGWMSAIPRFFSLVKMAIVGWVKKQVGTDFNQILTAERYSDTLGIKDNKSTDKTQTESEAQTERQKKSTAKAIARIVEPSIFYSNTIDFQYDFFEFANRHIARPFEMRFEYSNLLYDNLVNNNNANPTQSFQAKFSQLKQILTEGDWQGEVDLYGFEVEGFFQRILGGGTTFYQDITKYFQPWRPRFKTFQSYTHGDTGASDGGQGQEEVDVEETTKSRTEKQEVNKEKTGGDNCALERCGSYVYGGSSYIKKEGDSTNYFHQIISQVPSSDWHDGTPSPNSTWKFKVGASGSISISLPAGSYKYKLHTFQPTSGDSRDEGTISDVTSCSFTYSITSSDSSYSLKISGCEETTITWTEKNYKYNFKFDRQEFEKEEEIKGVDYKEPDFIPNETELDADIDMDLDEDKPDLDFDDYDTDDKDAQEREEDEDLDFDADKDPDKDEEKDDDEELDTDLELDSDDDKEEDTDTESDDDTESEKDDTADEESDDDVDDKE